MAPGGALLLCVCGLFAISSFRRKQAEEEHKQPGEEEAEEAFIPQEEAERTATMTDSFAVLNKGNAVIGNENRPCVLNLKMHLVVPDEEGEGGSRSGVTSSPRPVTAQSSLSAQHSSPPAASADTGQCLVSYP